MKAIMVMFDTLNRRMLPPYGCDWTHAPNFARLAERTVTFDNAYVGSMPCMPARRELHTGRYNFLHRSWGPLEPFDDSMPRLLHENGVHTHLSTDHYHYWEDGGATYHNRYSSYEFFRGQEGDFWIGQIDDPEIPPNINIRSNRQDWVNRKYMRREQDQPQPQTFDAGLMFMRNNAESDNWFLQIETFDPHEPFFTQNHYKDLYPHDYDGPVFDWPPYEHVSETPEQVQHMRYEYAALLSMCDRYLGQVLDLMDELNLWEDTMLIVNTDHGFLLGEHEFWAKVVMPFWNEVAHIPLFIWDPRTQRAGDRNESLVQTIDLPATLLEFFGVNLPEHMQGIPLRQTLADNSPVRDAALFGVHGGHVNLTDGRYIYMRAPSDVSNAPLFNYTLMPTHMNTHFSDDELTQTELVPSFSFTRDMPLLKTPSAASDKLRKNALDRGTLLYDLENDPAQQNPIQDAAVEAQMVEHLTRLMRENDAPAEQFVRLGLEG